MIFLNKAATLTALGFGSAYLAAAEGNNPKDSSPRSLTSEPFYCSEALDCRDCVENDCAWSMGECVNSCDDMADASCYTKGVFNDQTSRQICRQEWNERRDWELCGNLAECSDCTSTPLYGGDSNCFWYEETNSCKPVPGDGFSTGTDRCFTDPKEKQCHEAGTSCNACLENDCVWSAGQCLPSCDMIIADTGCWGKQTYPQLGVMSICQLVKVEEDDENLCSVQSDCFECTGTIRFDGVNTCEWYNDPESSISWCGTGEADMNGISGSRVCEAIVTEEIIWVDIPAKAADSAKQASTSVSEADSVDETKPCATMSGCLSCLDNDNGCAWSGDSCQADCDAVTDAACYKESTFTRLEEEDICRMAGHYSSQVVFTQDLNEQNPCSNMTNCLSCMKNDNQCSWTYGVCLDDSDVPEDSSSYSESNFPELDGEAICHVAEQDAINTELCLKTSCDACTSTAMLDGVSTCTWYTFEDGETTVGWCGTGGCDMMGNCGTDTCPKEGASSTVDTELSEDAEMDKKACPAMNTCTDCLDNDNECAWINGSCQVDCSADTTGAACYTQNLYPRLEEEQICRLAGDYRTSTDSLDDVNSIEETMSCRNMTSCLSCLENDNHCAWLMGTCENSCDDIADTSCYAESTFPELEEGQICRIAEEEAINHQLCNSSSTTTCEECTSTKMLDGSSTCSWHTADYDRSITWCGTDECDMWGNCGSKTCSAAAPSNTGSVRGGGNQDKAHKSFFGGWFTFP